MTANLLNFAAIIFYLISWYMITACVRASIENPENCKEKRKYFFLVWFVALAIHITSIHLPVMNGEPLSFSFFTLSSYVMWFISLLLFITTISRKIESLAIIILPITILSILLSTTIGSGSERVVHMHSGLGIHILISLLAYSVLMLASFQSLLLHTQNKHLHNRQNNGFIRSLPSLEDMEHFLFRLIIIGVILLTISLISGFYYLENLFGSNVAHKTILSIISWVIFTSLLVGRWKYGWRGKTAVRWTLAGFLVLALAFFGSKFIQEFVIDKDIAQIGTPLLIDRNS
ncbi:cytochrome c biogenesis protein CcsA [Cocleimonas sp. KMM 6892]|uniref:cytochrome C assembly family protein n=1 Tax=unclassified Cocleimonas TaxID=2639732 RepID=UPI002DBA739E|nr:MULTISPECIES: cytochrome c biogenesis protein CcsA [unclassified Cocleimonas]MEB8432920.1 cytochrome c biogenesis protein CcsA [Cocleimonas sp. KMM 6892]MEC4716099.1 cytochrome c biogenesis protein CcsA [Cocleimonas sp. KMM 6895]MEC4745560.1 cytochrome c biogenesis protein CcsA [Cocleimonas sp. KMM 6896]